MPNNANTSSHTQSPIDTLDSVGVQLAAAKIEIEKQEQSQLQKKISEAFYDAYTTYSHNTKNQEALHKLLKSGINGSSVKVSPDYHSILTIFNKTTDWKEVVTTTDEISYEGRLPKEYKALAAYVTLEEIHKLYGNPGLAHVHFAEGTHEDDPFYAYTPLAIQTNIITVQFDPNGDTLFKQWFAGRDVFSILQMGMKDVIVRCNWRPRLIKS